MGGSANLITTSNPAEVEALKSQSSQLPESSQDNPYTTPKTQAATSKVEPNLLRALVILNAVLLALLLFVLAVVLAWAFFHREVPAIPAEDIVSQQHFVFVEIDAWFAAVFFLIPNALLMLLYSAYSFRIRTHRPKDLV